MVRNKIISLGMAALLSVNGLWDASPAFYESMVASAKTATQTKEEVEVVSDVNQVNAANYGLKKPRMVRCYMHFAGLLMRLRKAWKILQMLGILRFRLLRLMLVIIVIRR